MIMEISDWLNVWMIWEAKYHKEDSILPIMLVVYKLHLLLGIYIN